VIACLVCLPAALPIAASRTTDWIVVGYLGVFQIGLAYVWITRGVRVVPAFEAALLLLLEPVLNVFWTWLVHGEWPGTWSLAGCLVVLGATVGHTLALLGQRSATR
jgi:drug/metabolite transporter (DMT)-like permease